MPCSKKGQLQDACNLYQQSLDTDKSNPPTLWGLSQCAITKGNLALARQHLDAALELKNKQAQTWIYIGDLAQRNKDIEGALSAYTSALKIDPENLAALESRSTINTRLGRMEPARSDIETIRKVYPNSLAAHYLQAMFKFREKKFTETRDALLEALKIAPNYVPALILAGLNENALGNLQTAESYLNKAVRAAPRNSFALRLLAETQLRLGRPDDAAKRSHRSISKRPGMPAFMLSPAKSLWQRMTLAKRPPISKEPPI
jgi:tetratricopeptide (TPR) repeat protein